MGVESYELGRTMVRVSASGRTYLDHAATTPMVPAAVDAVAARLRTLGNPSSLHGSGRSARRVVEEGREQIAALLGAKPAEVIFTSGGTEADNLAVLGAYGARSRAEGRSRVVVSAVEHHAVLDPARWLASAHGSDVVEVAVDGDGRVRLDELTRVTDDRTALVSVMWGNNEIGTLQPIADVVAIAHRDGAWVHSDAVQAVGHVPVDFDASGLDLLTVTAHKLGGPVGVGALVARRELALDPVLHGGGQERDVRSGTLDVVGIAGFAAALELAVGRLDAERGRLDALRTELRTAILAAAPDAVVHGPDDSAGVAERLPGVLNVELPGCSADALLLLLDAAGIDCSTGSACTAGVAQPSHVLLAVGRTETQARSALRFSLGHTSSSADVEVLAAALPEILTRARAFS